MNIKELEVKFLTVPKDSLVLLSVKDWEDDYAANSNNIIGMLKALNEIGKPRGIQFAFVPELEATVIKKKEENE